MGHITSSLRKYFCCSVNIVKLCLLDKHIIDSDVFTARLDLVFFRILQAKYLRNGVVTDVILELSSKGLECHKWRFS